MLRFATVVAAASLIVLSPAHAQSRANVAQRFAAAAVASVSPPAAVDLRREISPPHSGVASLLIPADFRGSLDDNDPQRQSGQPYEEHAFRVDEGHDITVTMTADDFDTYLIVRAPSGEEWENDDFGGTRMSQVSFSAVEAGMYTIWASAYSADGRGDYEIRTSAKAATILSTVSGRLDYQDRLQIKGEYFDTLVIRPPTSGAFYVELLPLGFSGYLRLTSPSGVHHATQPSGSDSRSMRVGPIQGQAGEWTVDVTTNGAGQVGAYDLRVIRLDEQ